MAESKSTSLRFFKTAWFSKAANKAGISDMELCKALHDVVLGKADSLGGGVYKKRISKNQRRSIVLGKGRQTWVAVFLFAKNDRQNIDTDELDAFRKLADLFAIKTDDDIRKEIGAQELLEICN